jgi:hypothetical protein
MSQNRTALTALVLLTGCRYFGATNTRANTAAAPSRLVVSRLDVSYTLAPLDLPRKGTNDRLAFDAARPLPESPPHGLLAVLPGGGGLLVGGIDGIWRVADPDSGEVKLADRSSRAPMLDALSWDGTRAITVRPEGRASICSMLTINGGAISEVELARFRNDFGVAISSDGSRAALAGAPTTCTEAWLGKCGVDLWAIDLHARPTALRRLSPEGTRAYHPIFVNGSDGNLIAYQTTEFDLSPACKDNINICRHDVVLRDFLGHDAPTVLHEEALQPTYSSKGDRFAFLTYNDPEASCHQRGVTCQRESLWVADASQGRMSAPRRIVVAGVAMFRQSTAWSPDGAWLLYRAADDDRTSCLVRADGSETRYIPDKNLMVRGWLR